MTKSKKQREAEVRKEEDKKRLILVGLSAATIVFILYSMAG